MEKTPVHDRHNHDLLKPMPLGSWKVVEVGFSSGALAREYKTLKPNCTHIGIGSWVFDDSSIFLCYDINRKNFI